MAGLTERVGELRLVQQRLVALKDAFQRGAAHDQALKGAQKRAPVAKL